MKRKWLIFIAAIVLCPVLLLLGVLLLQKPFVVLKVNGKTTAVARQFFIDPILSDSSADVYAGKEKIFSLREDFFDTPIFIYPFADGERFLCDYDDDVAMLDFIVDFRASATNELNTFQWPQNYQVRIDLLRMATNVVFDTKGIVRLPNYDELQEVSSYLTSPTSTPIKAGYFNFWPKEILLLDLATNRDSDWPMAK
jgi:hypothetical protein